MARVPEDERLRIVELYTKEYSQRAVAAMVKRPLKTVNRIIQAFRDENRIKDAPRKPRPRVTTQEDDMNIVAYVADNPRASVSEIRQCFQLTASKTTVKRRLAEAGLKSRMAVQKPLLTNVNKSKRLSFTQRHEAWSPDDWGRVVFSDECTFTTKWDQRARVWRPDRTRFRPEFVQRVAASGRTVVSVWAASPVTASDPSCAYKGPSQRTNTEIFWTPSASRTSPVTSHRSMTAFFSTTARRCTPPKRSIAYYSSAE
ncbi:hypothetical protein HPB52_021086 [Rhipicephalus sanguineus]|uniref:Transposase Tc1-like domain-containing protein n=1 Tax=Rhipicephalus sanguineus TaxID=34632 RepID=A0A9D4SP47_RHISA|nr:hypothetical protein HPB52_021086 [Rhipicephalus sanguineus]